jgi:L-rhamnose 1-dehydrogenase
MSDRPGRVVLVTGASRGIGRAIAVAFGDEGARVVVNHPGENDNAEETARLVRMAGGEPLVVEADVADVEAVRHLVARVTEEWGCVDVLVNNAGICPHVDFFDIDVELWDRVHAVNLRGVFLTTQEVTRRMVAARRGGRVISVSSISAWVGGALQVHYCPTKAGVSSLMKSLAIVLGPYGITCNAVLPGVIHTDINRHDMQRPGRRESVEARIPLGRLGEPKDVAGAVTLLARPEAGYINGAELLCDGGMFVNLL